jgi:hypothetical protein
MDLHPPTVKTLTVMITSIATGSEEPANKTHGSHRPFGSHISTMRNSQQKPPSNLGSKLDL